MVVCVLDCGLHVAIDQWSKLVDFEFEFRSKYSSGGWQMQLGGVLDYGHVVCSGGDGQELDFIFGGLEPGQAEQV